MKKLLVAMMLFALMLSIPVLVMAAEGDTVCGKSYKWDSFTMEFSASPFGPGCSGIVEVMAPYNQTVVYQFITSDNFITVFDLGEFVLRNSELIFLEPDGIRLTEY